MLKQGIGLNFPAQLAVFTKFLNIYENFWLSLE